MKCSEEKHTGHPSFGIANKVEKFHLKWKTLKENIQTNLGTVTISYEELKPLILYLEEAMLHPAVHIYIGEEKKWITPNYIRYD